MPAYGWMFLFSFIAGAATFVADYAKQMIRRIDEE